MLIIGRKMLTKIRLTAKMSQMLDKISKLGQKSK